MTTRVLRNGETNHLHLSFDADNFQESEFQRSLHTVPPSSNDYVVQNYYRPMKRVSYSPTVYAVLESTTNVEKGTATYTADTSFHFLLTVYLRAIMPRIVVAEKYVEKIRVCWPHNVGHAIIVSGQLSINGSPKDSITMEWLDSNAQWFSPSGAGKRETQKLLAGSTPHLEEWGTYLPSMPINVIQPYSFTRHPYTAFPLLAHSSMGRIEFKYNFNLKVTDLIKMQAFDKKNGQWTDIMAKEKYLKVGDNNSINNMSKVAIPEMWGKYANVTEWEHEHWTRDSDGTPIVHEYAYYGIQQIVSDVHVYGQQPRIDINSTGLVVGISFMARSVESENLHNRSNYTTNSHNHEEGWHPIRSAQLFMSNTPRTERLEYDQFSGVSGLLDTPSAPDEQGYGWIGFGDFRKGFANITKTGLYLNSSSACQIGFELENTNPYSGINADQYQGDDDDDDEIPELMMARRNIDKNVADDEKFTIIIILMTLRKVNVGINLSFELIKGDD